MLLLFTDGLCKRMNSSTFFTLIAEFGTGDIPLEKCCDKYFGMSLTKASAHAKHQKLPIPAYPGGSQKKYVANQCY